MERDLKTEIITLKSYLNKDNVTPTQHYLVWIRPQHKISFVMSFTNFWVTYKEKGVLWLVNKVLRSSVIGQFGLEESYDWPIRLKEYCDWPVVNYLSPSE